MTERLPRSAWTIDAVETAGDLIEIDLRLFIPAREDPFQVQLVGGMFVRFPRTAHRQLDEFPRDIIGLLVEPVIGPLAVAPRLQQPCVLQQTQVRRDARLTHARDFLQLVDRKFVLLQQRHNAQARRVGQGSQGFQSG